MSTTAFEDLTPGRIIALGEVTVDRDEMLAFAERFDPQPFHLDEQAGKKSVLGGLAASGWFTAALWMRQYVDHLLTDSTSQGSPGGRDLKWLAPVFAGDVLRCELTVIGARVSRSRPELGLVEITGAAYRSEEAVYELTFTGIFATRVSRAAP